MYDIRELAYEQFSHRILEVADIEQVKPQVMLGACLLVIRAVYSVLPKELRRDYASALMRFANELEKEGVAGVR